MNKNVREVNVVTKRNYTDKGLVEETTEVQRRRYNLRGDGGDTGVVEPEKSLEHLGEEPVVKATTVQTTVVSQEPNIAPSNIAERRTRRSPITTEYAGVPERRVGRETEERESQEAVSSRRERGERSPSRTKGREEEKEEEVSRPLSHKQERKLRHQRETSPSSEGVERRKVHRGQEEEEGLTDKAKGFLTNLRHRAMYWKNRVRHMLPRWIVEPVTHYIPRLPDYLSTLLVTLLSALLISGLADLLARPSVPSVKLHNAAARGMTMPIFGLGTGGYGDQTGFGGAYWNESVAEAAVTKFLKLGGRRIDCSLYYGTQPGVARAWKKSGIPRDQLFFTSKTDSPHYMIHPGVPAGYDETILSVAATLQELELDYIDLMLVHWPGLDHAPKGRAPPCFRRPNNWTKCRLDAWHALEDLFRAGYIRAIGVSNYEVKHLMEILNLGGLLPSVNQIEFHPYWHEDELVHFCQAHNIQVNGYAPLGTPDHMAFHPLKMPVLLINHEVVTSIARRLRRSPAQVLMRYSLDKGLVINPRSKNEQHMQEMLSLNEFELSKNDIARLDALDQPPRKVCEDPHEMN